MLTIKEIKDKNTWESFLIKKDAANYPFFQSWNWGEVQKKLGFKIFRLGFYENAELIGICQAIDIIARRGRYLHLRHGPIILDFDKYFQDFFSLLKTSVPDSKANFIRISPLVKKENIDTNILAKMGFRNAPIHNQDAEICWVLDITGPKEELLKEMRKTHRYMIKKALSMSNLKIIKTANIKDIRNFLPLYKNLSERKHFVAHKGVEEEFEVFSKENEEVLFLAEYNKKIIAGALIAYAGDSAIYRHSASHDSFKQIPSMYLILWEAILEAKNRHKKIFNFWGIAPSDSKNHPWFGLSLFKMGFGGEKREFLHAQDLPLNLKYWKTYLIESVSKKMKGY